MKHELRVYYGIVAHCKFGNKDMKQTIAKVSAACRNFGVTNCGRHPNRPVKLNLKIQRPWAQSKSSEYLSCGVLRISPVSTVAVLLTASSIPAALFSCTKLGPVVDDVLFAYAALYHLIWTLICIIKCRQFRTDRHIS
jgi:hypothetical protein